MESLEQLIKDNPTLEVLRDEPMANHTNYRVGGVVRYYFKPNDNIILSQIMKIIEDENIPHFLLGNGSNILFGDEMFDGVVISLKNFNGYKIEGDVLYAKSGCLLPALAHNMAQLGLSGLEFLSGVPGTLGGAVYMNAGAYNKEIKDMLISVDVLHGSKMYTLTKEQLSFSYRTSSLQQQKDIIVLGATLQLEFQDKEHIMKLMIERRERRKKSQPYDLPCAGSVFRNPLPQFSWQLIEECGLRGHQIGGAQVSTLHANFIVNVGDATATDIINLIKHVQKEVYEKTQIELETEVEMVNW